MKAKGETLTENKGDEPLQDVEAGYPAASASFLAPDVVFRIVLDLIQ